MNKPIARAIAEGHPLYWEVVPSSFCRLRLVAEVFTWENGRVRTRTLWTTYDELLAHYQHGEILAQGGKLQGPTPKEIYERWQENQP